MIYLLHVEFPMGSKGLYILENTSTGEYFPFLSLYHCHKKTMLLFYNAASS